MQQRSRVYQLIEDRLGSDLEAWVTEQRNQAASWNTIAIGLHTRTGVTVTGESLRNWFDAKPRGAGNQGHRAKAVS